MSSIAAAYVRSLAYHGGDKESRHGATPRHCHYKEKENNWPHPPTAERKTSRYTNVLGAGRRQKRGGGEARRHGDVHSKKTWKRWVLAGVEPAGSPVTVRDGDFSSPDAPRGPVLSLSK